MTAMFFFLFFSFSITTVASKAIRSTCSDGKTVSDASCCVWYTLYDELKSGLFNNVCDEVASDAIRLAFHDAIGHSPALTAQGGWGGGGADGSIMTFAAAELSYPGNNGLQSISGFERIYADLNHVSYGDIIQFSNAVALSLCPGAPDIRFLSGRPEAQAAAPESSLPGVSQSVDLLLARFEDAGFSANELVDLLASHSLAFQEHLDETVDHTPLDSTPGVMDAQFYVETLLNGTDWTGVPDVPGEALSPLDNEFRLLSDHRLARDPRTACRWQSAINQPQLIAERFKTAMEKLSVTGQNLALLTDCTEAIPSKPYFQVPAPHLPAGKTLDDIEGSCEDAPFPSITADPGPSTAVATPTHVDDDDRVALPAPTEAP